MFNGARHLTCQSLWLLFLLQYERVSKPRMTNVQLGYYNLFSSWFSQSSSPFSLSGLDLDEFIVGVIISVLLPFCEKEFIDFGFQVSIWNPEFVSGSDLRPIWLQSLLFSFLLTPMWFGIRHIISSSLFDIESSLLNSLIISKVLKLFLLLNDSKT